MSIEKAPIIIQREQRTLGTLLLCFETRVNQIETREREPDFGIPQAISMHLDAFLDTFHHPKERHLFPAVVRRHPCAAPLVHELQQLCAALRSSLADSEARGAHAFPRCRDNALVLITF